MKASMDEIDHDIALAIRLALDAGYDVEIRVMPTVGGGSGRVRMPMALINMVADEKRNQNREKRT